MVISGYERIMSGYERLRTVARGIVTVLIGLQGGFGADINELMLIIPWFWSYLAPI